MELFSRCDRVGIVYIAGGHNDFFRLLWFAAIESFVIERRLLFHLWGVWNNGMSGFGEKGVVFRQVGKLGRIFSLGNDGNSLDVIRLGSKTRIALLAPSKAEHQKNQECCQ